VSVVTCRDAGKSTLSYFVIQEHSTDMKLELWSMLHGSKHRVQLRRSATRT
jgi:hypothetical protein